jgi:hypothetical protein
MMTRRLSLLFFVAALVGCGPALQPLPPAPTGVQRIAVQEPANRTGDKLVVTDPGWIGQLLDEKHQTVPGLLAADLRDVLAKQGFKVAAASKKDTPSMPALRTEIRRWEPYSADYSMVTVDVAASLVDESGRELWKAERTSWNVPTRDARSSREASMAASTAIAQALVEGWKPGNGAAATNAQ